MVFYVSTTVVRPIPEIWDGSHRRVEMRNLHLYGRCKETWNIRKWGILLNDALMRLSIFSLAPVYAASTGVYGCNIPKFNTWLVPALVTA